MNQQKRDILVFWGLVVLLNGLLAGSRGLASPLHTLESQGLTLFIALFLAALFGAATFLWSAQTMSLINVYIRDLLLPMTGGVILFSWGLNLPLWNEWLWSLVLNSIIVPLLFLPKTQNRSKQAHLAVLCVLMLLNALLWFTFIKQPAWPWWQWLFICGGTTILFTSWFLRQTNPQIGWIITGTALILFMQLALIILFLPIPAPFGVTLIVMVFGVICWLGHPPLR